MIKVKYSISGDGTGVTYGVYAVPENEDRMPTKADIIKNGIPSLKAAQKEIAKLKDKDHA